MKKFVLSLALLAGLSAPAAACDAAAAVVPVPVTYGAGYGTPFVGLATYPPAFVATPFGFAAVPQAPVPVGFAYGFAGSAGYGAAYGNAFALPVLKSRTVTTVTVDRNGRVRVFNK